ncbi:hypothetical protein ONZ45_g2805 [Pleurotus djamor]|nr:hypothetical protein ONZ45_g2805 [Pleurotus djamor]
MKSPALMLFILFSLLVSDGDAKAINLTVDDQFVSNSPDQPSIEYDGDWKKDGFRVLNWDRHSSSLARQFANSTNGTWTKSTFDSSQSFFSVARFNFTGTAVFVQCILTHATRDRIPGNSQFLFTLDGVNTNFTKDALEPGVATVTTVFSKTDLSSGAHALTIQNGFPGGPHSHGLIFLDSIIYTTDDDPPAPPENTAFGTSTPNPSTGDDHSDLPTILSTKGAIISMKSSPLTSSTSSPQTQPSSTSTTALAPPTPPPPPPLASQPSSKGTSPNAPIVLGSIAGVSLLLLILIALYIWRRRRNSAKTRQHPNAYASLYPFRFPRRQQQRASVVSASTLTFDPGFYSTEDDDSYTPTKRSFALSPTEKAPFYDVPSTLGYGHGYGR